MGRGGVGGKRGRPRVPAGRGAGARAAGVGVGGATAPRVGVRGAAGPRSARAMGCLFPSWPRLPWPRGVPEPGGCPGGDRATATPAGGRVPPPPSGGRLSS